jgi:signal transduction histidine kinase
VAHERVWGVRRTTAPVDDAKAPSPQGSFLQGPAGAESAYVLTTRSEDLHRSEAVMIVVRWCAVPWAFLQIFSYREFPYPPGTRATALGFASLLTLGNLGILVGHRRTRTLRDERQLTIVGVVLDLVVASGMVWVFAFDQSSALWAILFLLPLEGAVLYQLEGASWVWGATAVLYVTREIWGSGHYGYPLRWESISFRMGIGFLIALAAGLMSRALVRQREELAAALRDLHRVDRLRAGLVTTLAHDVRNPLAAIRASIQTLLTHPERRDAIPALLSVADRQARRLERLAHQILELARLEQGQLDLALQDVTLLPVVQRALSYADGAERIEVRVGEDVRVRADPDRLEQIVLNLATNQLRYGEPPFAIEAHTHDHQVTLSFSDHGRGISADKQAGLFEPFGTRSDAGSVGLGLAIVRALVDAHGGRVVYRGTEDGGACFDVVLPAPTAGPGDRSRPHPALA